MKADARRIRAALDAPSDCRLFLLHGPDEAGAQALAARLAARMGPAADRVDLDGATLRHDPARLADEAATLSLFGGERFIRVTAAGEESLAAFETLLAAERVGHPVVAIAPTVKTSAKIVKLAIDSPLALAHACYVPEGAAAERLATEMARDAGLRLAPGVAAHLAAAAAGDRAVMAQEIEKLALYLDADADRPCDAEAGDLAAIAADIGDSENARMTAAVVAGDPVALGDELDRLAEAQVSPVAWLRHLSRQLLALADMRAAIDRGDPADAVIKRQRIHFSQEASIRRALGMWTAPMLATALARVRRAERDIMAAGTAGNVLAEAAVLELSRRLQARR